MNNKICVHHAYSIIDLTSKMLLQKYGGLAILHIDESTKILKELGVTISMKEECILCKGNNVRKRISKES